MKNTIILLSLFCMLSHVSLAQDRITGTTAATRSEVIAQNGMAATSQPLATQVALDVLKKGGSAIDAAIAANATLGLMEPTGCGIGGDLFAIVWDAKTKQLYGLNASGRSPKGMTLAYFKEKGLTKIPSHGPIPVSVPGAVDGWFELHEKFGKLPIDEILAPAIGYAEYGFPVSELIAWYMGRSVPFFIEQGFPNIKETYTVDGENPPKKGQIFKNPRLAKTYRTIAEGGRDAYYKGPIAKKIANFIQSQGGFLAYEDFASHQSEWIDPVSTNYRGIDVWELPPNGQGIAALQMLNLLEPYDFSKIPFGSAEHLHLFTEAKKIVFEDRAKYYADMDFAKVPVNTLISKDYAKQRGQLLDENSASEYKAGEISAGETIYMTVADKDGNMISLIQSNYRGMGSGMVADDLGFMLQDRGELFSLEEGQNNTYEPGKRPFHTIIPAFATKDGEPFLSFGVMGGDFQPMGHVQIIMNMVDFGMNLQEAGDAPRISHGGGSSPMGARGGKGIISLEAGLMQDYQMVRKLMDLGHEVKYSRGIYGGYQAIQWDPVNKVFYGASESRKDGQAAGY